MMMVRICGRNAFCAPFLAIFIVWSLSISASHVSSLTNCEVKHTAAVRRQLNKSGRGLNAQKWRRSYFDSEDEQTTSSSLVVDRPTLTKTEREGPATSKPKPKIVVLGATGKIGRQVISQLMEMSLDCTVVAVVRDLDHAAHVFYSKEEGSTMALVIQQGGPELQVVKGDLVPDEMLPGNIDKSKEEEEKDWRERAESAAKFYGNDVQDYDNRPPEEYTTVAETLETAFRDVTAIISCVGAVRPTNVWTDLIQFPLWRLLRRNVSGWCRDKRHPFYVHYATTRQVLWMAENEQRRRDALQKDEQEDDDDEDNESRVPPRIRLIRISDLCVAQQAWEFVPLLTNALQSLVFEYQAMAERILNRSNLIDTIILRPGDLMDEDREVDTVGLQVDCSGRVPSPARVGRADVAALAIESALFDDPLDNATTQNATNNTSAPFHYTLAVRWVGQEMHPFPPQGLKSDGCTTARQCMKRVLKTEAQKRKRRRRLEQIRGDSTFVGALVERATRQVGPPPKPYAICAALLWYFFLGLLLSTLVKSILSLVPGGAAAMASLTQWRNKGLDAITSRFSLIDRMQLLQSTPTVPKPSNIKRVRRPRMSKSYISF